MQSFKMLGCLHTYRRLLVSLVLCVAALLSAAQNTTIVRGVVLDSISNEPLPNVSVMLGETGMGTMTDTNGSFEIKSQSDFSQVTFSTLGYKSQSANIKSGRNNKLHIALSPMYIPLEEVLVEPSKEKYSKKNNPAVDLARRLIAMRAQQDSLAPYSGVVEGEGVYNRKHRFHRCGPGT